MDHSLVDRFVALSAEILAQDDLDRLVELFRLRQDALDRMVRAGEIPDRDRLKACIRQEEEITEKVRNSINYVLHDIETEARKRKAVQEYKGRYSASVVPVFCSLDM